MLIVDPTLTPSQKTTEMAILLTATCVARLFAIVAAVVAVVWCVSLYFEVIVELSIHIAPFSIQSDPVVHLVMLARIISAVAKLARLDGR